MQIVKQFTAVVLGLILTVSPAFASWDIGFSFRATSGYVTDPTGVSCVIASATTGSCTGTGADIYPQTYGNGVTAGFTSGSIGSMLTSDRSTGVDVRLAGIGYTFSTAGIFLIDTPCTSGGTFKVTLGLGDGLSSTGMGQTQIQDGNGGSALLTINHANTASNEWYDASDAQFTSSNWATNNVAPAGTDAVSVTTTQKTIAVNISLGAGTLGIITHIFLSQQGACAGGGLTPAQKARGFFGILPDSVFDQLSWIVNELRGRYVYA